MIEVHNLAKKYGDYVAVSDISFSAKKGEIVGFLGPNGAGKTTTIRMLATYLPPSALPRQQSQASTFKVSQMKCDAELDISQKHLLCTER